MRSGNHYCIGLKGNQAKLLQQAQAAGQSQSPLSEYREVDTAHGRLVERLVQVFAAESELGEQWMGLAGFVGVQRRGIRAGKAFDNQSWYLVSQLIPAKQAAALIRNHRGSLENRVHWVKDVVQQEDGSLIRAAGPATVMGMMRTWALSLFRKAGYQSLTQAMRLCKHDLPKLLSFF